MTLHLARHPDTRETLEAEPGLIDSAIEEFLRYYGPSQGVRRTLTEDATLHGRDMKRGEPVWLVVNAADRDNLEFEHADDIVLNRPSNRQLGLGVGTHRCVGAHLSRLMLRVVLQEVTRAPRFSVRDEHGLRWGMGVTRNLEAVPVEFDRSGSSR